MAETTQRELADRLEITDLISRYGQIADEKRFDDSRSCCTEDVVAEYHFGRAQGVDVLAQYGRQALGAFERTHHLISNVLVDLAGDTATASANLLAVHIQRADDPGNHFDLGGRYRFDAVRTPRGWRISRVRLDVLWSQGHDPRGLAVSARG
jgi:SnoaL-like domain